jgi:hypothetical protein
VKLRPFAPGRRPPSSWTTPGEPGSGKHQLTFVRLIPIAAGTRLDLTHTGLPAAEQPKHAVGWGHCFARAAIP